jgi:tetratricopeptide (TPR) repeat protein
MLSLPRVSLVCVDCVNPTAAVIAMRRSMDQCTFARAVLLTDESPKTVTPGIDVIPISGLASREAYSHFMLNHLGQFVSSDYALVIQWDGYVVNAGAWSDGFLDYDYIGAKWWHKDGCNVGNGGFSLRSKRLLDAVKSLGVRSSILNEDDVICRIGRPALEARHGIRFAPESVADQFAFERIAPKEPVLPFGFHGLFNMWRFLSSTDLQDLFLLLDPRTIAYVETLELVQQYIQQKRYQEAVWLASRVLVINRDNIAALRLLSVAAFHAGRMSLVGESLQKLHRIDPLNADYLADLGDLAAAAKQTSEASNYYRKLLAIKPNDGATLDKLRRLCGATAEMVEASSNPG